MKKIVGTLTFVFVMFFCGVFFCACTPEKISASFSATQITIEMGEMYNPYDFVKEKISEDVKEKIDFEIANTSVACVNTDKKIVAVGYGTTTLYLTYDNQNIASTTVYVPRPKIELSTPTNLRYENGLVVWNYVNFNYDGELQQAPIYALEVTKNGTTSVVENLTKNSYSITDFGTYSVKVKTCASSSAFIESGFSDAITVTVMAKPLNLEFNAQTNTISWSANTNPAGTEYEVTYSINGKNTKSEKVSTTNFVISEKLNAGSHLFYVEALAMNENYFSTKSDVLTVKKLQTPEVEFDDGIISWDAVESASEYKVEIFENGQLKFQTTVAKSEEDKISTTLAKEQCTEAGKSFVVNVTAIGNGAEVLNSEKSEDYTFKKLSDPQLVLNSQTNEFKILNGVLGKTKMTLTNLTSLQTWVSENENLVWTITDTEKYGISAQIITENSECEISSNVISVFTLENASTKFSTMQNMEKQNAWYYELNGKSYIALNSTEQNCLFDLKMNDASCDLTINNGIFELGDTSAMFYEDDVIEFEVTSSKNVQGNYYFPTSTSLFVEKLTSPTSIKVENGKVVVAEENELATKVQYLISTDLQTEYIETTTLSKNASYWNILVRNIAPTSSKMVNEKTTYYSSSDATTFHIRKLDSVQDLVFNYKTSVLTFSKVENASYYQVFQNGEVIATTQKTQVELDGIVGTIQVVANPESFSVLTSSVTGFVESAKSAITIYKVNEISKLELQKDALNVVSASWNAPTQNYDKSLKYSVFVKFVEDEYSEFALQASITENSYEFPSETFAQEGQYEIKVEVVSPNNDFYTTASTQSVTLTRLPAPEKLVRNNNTLSVSNFNDSKMTGIKFVVNDNDTEICNQVQTENSLNFEVANGHTLNIVASFEGVFDSATRVYTLNSLTSEFNIYRCGEVQNLQLDHIDGTTCYFTWDSYEHDENGAKPNYVKYSYSFCTPTNQAKNKTGSTYDNGTSHNNGREAFEASVREIVEVDDWTEIAEGGTVYLNCLNAVSVNAYQEKIVQNLTMDVEEQTVIVSWNYEPVYTIDSATYNPIFTVMFKSAEKNSVEVQDPSPFAVATASQKNGKYYIEYPLEKFNTAGDYTIKVWTTSSKTLSSVYKDITITKLDQIAKFKIDGTNGYFLDENSNNVDLSYGGAIQIESGLTATPVSTVVDLSEVGDGADTDVVAYIKAPLPSTITNGQYYLDSDTTTFRVIKLSPINVAVDLASKTLSWEEAQVVGASTNYDLKLSGANSKTINLSQNSIGLEDALLSNNSISAGVYQISVKTNVGTMTISEFDADDGNKGYLSSEFGTAVQVEKLQAPTNITLTAENTTKQEKVTLAWGAVSGATEYNVYFSTSANSVGEVKVSTTDTKVENVNWFTETGTYYVCVEAVAQGKIASSVSNKVTCVRLDPITNASLSSKMVLSWAKTSQIYNGTSQTIPFDSYILEVVDNVSQTQFSYNASQNYSYNLLNYTENTYLSTLDGGAFSVNITIKGNGQTTSDGVITLTSATKTIQAQKLFAPEIKIANNAVVIVDTNLSIQNVKYYTTISNGTENIFVGYYSSPIEINSLSQTFTISSFATVDDVVENVADSNVAELNSVQKLAVPQNLNLTASDAFEQKNLTLTWDAVSDATSYKVFVDDQEFSSVTNSYIFDSSVFATAKTYAIQVKAIKDGRLSSDLSTALMATRLSAMQGAYMAKDSVLHLSSSAVQKNVYVALLNSLSATVQSTTQVFANCEYDGFATWLSAFNGGNFYVETCFVGTGVTQNNTCTLTSDKTTISCFKLFEPTISITSSIMSVTTQNAETEFEGSTLSALAQNVFSAKFGSDYALTTNGQQIKNFTQSEFEYPNNWQAGEYTFFAQSLPSVSKNVLPSNVAEKSTTRLSAPTNLKFVRLVAGSEDYVTDDQTLGSKIGPNVKFEFEAQQYAVGYLINNGTTNFEEQSTSTSFNLQNDFQTFVYAGNALSVISLASDDGTYINSASSVINYNILSAVQKFYTNGNEICWTNTNSNHEGFLINATTPQSTTKYWQTTNPELTKSTLSVLGISGNLPLKLKVVGNVTESGTSTDVYLDSLYKEVVFEKLETISTLGTYQGFLTFEPVENATDYFVNVYDNEDNFLQKITLENYKTKMSITSNYYVGYNNQISGLSKTKTYKFKVVAKNSNSKTLNSEESNAISVQILENSNNSLALVNKTGNSDLTQKVVNLTLASNASGLWIGYNNKFSPLALQESTYQYSPNVTSGGEMVLSFANMGSTSDNLSVHYLTSSFTTLTLDAPYQTEIEVSDGMFSWSEIGGVDGYYVYINDNIYTDTLTGEKLYQQTTLELDETFGGLQNSPISIKVIGVKAGNNNLWSPSTTLALTQNVGENTYTNTTFVEKLSSPAQMNVSDGALLWTQGLTNLNSFSELTLNEYLGAIQDDVTKANVDALDDYLASLFTTPVNFYSKYSGFNAPTITLYLTDENDASYSIETSALKFLVVTETQKTAINTILLTLSSKLTTIMNSLNSTSTKLYSYAEQNFANEQAYLYARLNFIKTQFKSTNAVISSLLNNTETVWPSLQKLFSEFEYNQTASLPGGNYTLQIAQSGNSFDWLNSNKSQTQNIYVPKSCENVTITNDFATYGTYNFYLEWDKLTLPVATYSSFDGEEQTTDVVYLIFGNKANDDRVLITRTTGTQVGERLRLNLTELIENGTLTEDIKSIFLVVCGNYNSTSSETQVISGLCSRTINISILPQLAPRIENGVLTLSSEVANFGFEVKTDVQTNYLIGENTWVGDELSSGANYDVKVRNLGDVSEKNDNFVLSGKYFTFKVQKLATANVEVNTKGVFEWASVGNALGYILYVNNSQTLIDADKTKTTYEATQTGYNNFKFRMLGSTSSVKDSTTVYYLNSKVNNSESGLDACVISSIENITINDGCISWEELDTTNTAQNKVNLTENTKQIIGYKLTINNSIVLYTTELEQSEFYHNYSGMCVFDATKYGGAGVHNITIQAYSQIQNTLTSEVNNGKTLKTTTLSMYSQLLGEKFSGIFTKLLQPKDVKIENGKIVWTGNEEGESYYYEIYDANEDVIESGSLRTNELWPSTITPNTNYTFKVKAVKENCVYSTYSNFATTTGESVKFKKYPLPNVLDMTYEIVDADSCIIFDLPAQAINLGINVEYCINGSTEKQYLMCYDSEYEDVVSYQDNQFQINVTKLNAQIQSMNYSLQFVPLSQSVENPYVASNFTDVYLYSTPEPLDEVLFDDETKEYYFVIKGDNFGYSIRDEILNEDNEVVAVYKYTIPTSSVNEFKNTKYYKERQDENNNKIDTLNFAPVVAGYKHCVKVSVITESQGTNVACSSIYIDCPTLYFADIFDCEKDLFASDSGIKDFSTTNELKSYLKQYAYGGENNAFLVSSNQDFENMNLRLSKYSYMNSYTIEISDVNFGSVEVTEENVYFFKQTQDLTQIEDVIGIRTVSKNNAIKIVAFDNNYDGQNFKINYNLTPSDTTGNYALFRTLGTNGVLKNIELDGEINFNGVQTFAGLVALNNGVIDNVVIQNLVVNDFNIEENSVGVYTFGGLVAENYGTITNVVNFAQSTLTVNCDIHGLTLTIGGVVGENLRTSSTVNGIIKNVGNKMQINVNTLSTAYVGGVVGTNYGSVETSYSKASNINVSSEKLQASVYVGGVSAFNDVNGSISYCYAKGTISVDVITSSVFAGGIVGSTKSVDVLRCYSSVAQIVTKVDSENNPVNYGGTLIGKVDLETSFDNINYYLYDYAVGDWDANKYSNLKKTSLSELSSLASELNKINAVYKETNDIVFAWESNFE